MEWTKNEGGSVWGERSLAEYGWAKTTNGTSSWLTVRLS